MDCALQWSLTFHTLVASPPQHSLLAPQHFSPFLHCLSTTEPLYYLHYQAVIYHHAHGRPSGARTPRGSWAWHRPDTAHHCNTSSRPIQHITSLAAQLHLVSLARVY
ncbi:hypothetical protein E2C01_095473 [Portunus trituberculatus]|uniref:Uncharacterized protein n=1 Tax=Portunus trituberculatus TaxID=210409 RepID=A0A5B7K5W1_PORTR|nr:hypothetical protein [Portunus trituberculatus]